MRLSKGQSETASVPSRMPSVSRLGLATEPALPESDPADACRQALKADFRFGQPQPALQSGILRKQFKHLGVRLRDVLRIAGEGDPAERPLADAEHRPEIGRASWRERV